MSSGAESALVEKPCSGHSTLVISHNSDHTQVSLPPSLETRSQTGTRHWIYLTQRSGLCAPPAPTGVTGSLCQVPQQRIVSVRGRSCRDPIASPFYGPLTLDVTLWAFKDLLSLFPLNVSHTRDLKIRVSMVLQLMLNLGLQQGGEGAEEEVQRRTTCEASSRLSVNKPTRPKVTRKQVPFSTSSYLNQNEETF